MVQYNDPRIMIREQKSLIRESSMKKPVHCSCNSSSRINVRMLFGAEQAGARREAPTKSSRSTSPEAARSTSAISPPVVWAQDAQPYRAESRASADFKGQDGKSGEWRVGFASPAQHATKTYTWANGDISHGVDDTYSPSNSSTQIFNIQFLKTDTDKAFGHRPAARRREAAARRSPTRLCFMCWTGTGRPTNCCGT